MYLKSSPESPFLSKITAHLLSRSKVVSTYFDQTLAYHYRMASIAAAAILLKRLLRIASTKVAAEGTNDYSGRNSRIAREAGFVEE